jgi:hypothetical protein
VPPPHSELQIYAAEHIRCDAVRFADNKECLALMDEPHNGLFALLEVEGSFAKVPPRAYAGAGL